LDLNKLSTADAFDSGYCMQVMHPITGEPVEGMTITVVGQDSKRYLEAQRALTDKRLARIGKPATAKDLEVEEIDGLVAVTVAWTGFERNGVEIPFTATEVRRIYADHGFLWLRRQVNEAVHKRENFIAASPSA
jgi:hypothetical protein